MARPSHSGSAFKSAMPEFEVWAIPHRHQFVQFQHRKAPLPSEPGVVLVPLKLYRVGPGDAMANAAHGHEEIATEDSRRMRRLKRARCTGNGGINDQAAGGDLPLTHLANKRFSAASRY